jgi:undecaprenyl-diphosphatase
VKLWWSIVAAVGVLILGWSVANARQPEIPPVEARIFTAVNGLPDALFWPLWFPMQFGNLWIGGAAAMIAAVLARDLGVVIGVVWVMALKVVAEHVVQHTIGDYATIRQRPGTSEVGAVRRGGDVPSSGPSFPSGHVILVVGVSSLVTPILARPLIWVPALIIFLVMLAGCTSAPTIPSTSRRGWVPVSC